MNKIIILMLCIGSILLINIIWRFLSQHLTLPCPVWLSWLVERDNPFASSNQANIIIKFLDLKPNMKILDIGCGPGRVTIPLAKAIEPYGEVTAMDIQQGMLNRVKEKAQAANIHNIRYINSGIGNGTLEYNYYDRVLLVAVLGEIPHQKEALKEIFYTLKPGGILSVSELIFDPHFQKQKKVIQLAEEVGFQKKNSIGKWFAYTIHFEKPFK